MPGPQGLAIAQLALNSMFLPGQGVGRTLFLLEGEGRGQAALDRSVSNLSFVLFSDLSLPLMQEEYQEYEPEA